MTLRIATRRSKLALAQSHWVRQRLLETGLVDSVEIKEYVTRGDQIQNVPLAEVGGKGLFTKEIEDALLNHEADLAVHSLKDLPIALPPGLTLGAIPPREDPHDALVLPTGAARVDPADSLAALAEGAKVGSSSQRRRAQLLHARPDLQVDDVRGNVDTRLRKLDEGQYDALVLAAAGLRRLNLHERLSAVLSAALSTPAPGQGALGIECREDDIATREILGRLNDPRTHACVTAERAVLEAVGGGCSVPLGAFASLVPEGLRLTAVLASPTGERLLRTERSGLAIDAAGLGEAVARELLENGGRELLASLA